MNQMDQCQNWIVSPSSHISISSTSRNRCDGCNTEDQFSPDSPRNELQAQGETYEEEGRQCSEQRGFIFPSLVRTRGPKGHEDRFACLTLFPAACCKFIIVASQLPNSNLGGLGNLNGVCRLIVCVCVCVCTHSTHTHTDRQMRKVASEWSGWSKYGRHPSQPQSHGLYDVSNIHFFISVFHAKFLGLPILIQ